MNPVIDVDFAANADALLSRFGDDVADTLRELASQIAASRSPQPHPTVEVDDVKAAARILFKVLRRGADSMQELLEKLEQTASERA